VEDGVHRMASLRWSMQLHHADWERGVLKSKVVDNGFFFNFVFHKVSVKHFADEI
jgi:hypothetical protein